MQGGIRLRPPMERQICLHGAVRLPDGAETGRFRGHHINADAVVHGQGGNGRSRELQHLIFHEAVPVYRAAQGDGDIVRPHASGRPSGEPHQHHLRRGDVVGVFQQLLDDLGAALSHAHGAQRAVTGVAVGAQDHTAAAAHHLTGVLMDHRLIGGHIVPSVLHGGGQAEYMVVLIDGAAHGAQAVVAVGQHIGHGKFFHAAGLGGLDDPHIGDVVGDQTVEGQVQQAIVRRLVVAAEDLIGHGLFPPLRRSRPCRDRCAVLQHDTAAVQLDHRFTPFQRSHASVFLWETV